MVSTSANMITFLYLFDSYGRHSDQSCHNYCTYLTPVVGILIILITFQTPFDIYNRRVQTTLTQTKHAYRLNRRFHQIPLETSIQTSSQTSEISDTMTQRIVYNLDERDVQATRFLKVGYESAI